MKELVNEGSYQMRLKDPVSIRSLHKHFPSPLAQKQDQNRRILSYEPLKCLPEIPKSLLLENQLIPLQFIDVPWGIFLNIDILSLK
jgi:hypothetical protein